jgi:hypothetical protein
MNGPVASGRSRAPSSTGKAGMLWPPSSMIDEGVASFIGLASTFGKSTAVLYIFSAVVVEERKNVIINIINFGAGGSRGPEA